MTRFISLACALFIVASATGCGYFTSPEDRVERAGEMIAKGEHRSALIELRNAQQSKRDMPQARLLLAEVALWMGDLGAAERELKTVPVDHEPAQRADLALRIDLAAGRNAEVLARIGTPDDKQPAMTWLYRGLANQGLGNYADAERDYRAAFARDSQMVAAQAGIIEMRAAQNDMKDAFELSRTLTRDHPESALVWFVRGGLLASAASLREAQDALVHAAEFAPKQLEMLKHVALLAMLTEVQIANREIEKARATAGSLSRLAPGSPLSVVNSARVSMANNDFASSSVELRRLLNRVPQFTHARFMLGVSLAAQGNLTQANQELTQVVESMPSNMEARQLLAKVRMRLDDPDSALRVLVPALEAAGGDRSTNQLFEAASAQLGDSSRSLALIEREYNKTPGNRGLKLQLAAAYVRAQQGAKAQALLRTPDGAAPDLISDRLLLAATAQAEGEDAARRKLDSMLAARPNDAGLVLLAAQMHLAVREDQRARQLIEAALARQPDDAGLKLALARVQLVTGERAAAVETLTQIRRKDPRATEARLLLAQLALSRDDAKEASALIAEAVSGADKVSETQNSAGLIYLSTARYDAAIEHFRAGTEAYPIDSMLWLNLGRAQLALEQHEAARAALQRSLSLRANWLPAEGALAFLELKTGNTAGALKRVDALRTARPHDPEVMVLEAEVRAALRQYVEADKALALALRRQPSPELVLKNYQLRLAGELPKPTEPLETWVQANPEDVSMRRALADAYANAGLGDKATQQYEAVVGRQPRDAVALNNLAWLYFERGDRRAVDTARRAVALAPQSAPVLDTLGWILVESGNLKEGLDVLQRATEKDPASGDMQYHYAAGLAKSGKPAEAETRLRTLLAETAQFPSRKEAQELLTRLSKPQP